MKNVWAGLGVLLFLGSAATWFLSHKKANEYNDYIYKLRPILKAQDVVVKEITGSTIASARGKLENWRTRLREQLRMSKEIVPKKRQIKEIHAHWLRRSQHLIDGVEALSMYLKTRNPAHLKARTQHFLLAGKALKDFVKRRNKYFKKNNIRLKKK